MNIVSRQQWGAKPPRSRRTITLPTPKLFLHHTAGSEPDGADGVRRIQAFHMDTRGYADIAYSFVVDRDGVVFEGRGAGVAGAHTRGHNTTSHAICVIGHYDNERPTTATLDAVAALVAHGHTQGWWPNQLTGGHRDVGSTSCPGRHLYAQIDTINRLAGSGPQEDETMLTRGDTGPAVRLLQSCLQREARARQVPDPLSDYGVDGDFGAETETAVRDYQKAAGIDVTGRADGLTAALLFRYEQ